LPRHWHRAAAIATLALMACIFTPSTLAQNSPPTQFDVEAAYLYRFGNFVQWPPDAHAGGSKQFPICVLGRDPFGSTLDAMLKGSEINGIPIIAKRVTSAKDTAGCRILYLSSSETRRLDTDLAGLGDNPVLTVSDIPDFAVHGGMIQFVLIDQRVRFEINLSNAERTGLKVSSQLLKVAVAVRGSRNPKE
jgi:YfiR/HmsC-like